MDKKKYNYEAQEEVVTALWNLIRDNSKNKPNASHIDELNGNTDAYLPAIGDAMDVIMNAFGFSVQPSE